MAAAAPDLRLALLWWERRLLPRSQLLLRFRVTLQPEVGEWSPDKESTTALTSLQRNPVNLERSQLATLASLTGVTSNDAGAPISIQP